MGDVYQIRKRFDSRTMSVIEELVHTGTVPDAPVEVEPVKDDPALDLVLKPEAVVKPEPAPKRKRRIRKKKPSA